MCAISTKSDGVGIAVKGQTGFVMYLFVMLKGLGGSARISPIGTNGEDVPITTE